ncbi:MAG TPA: hypothetical protein PKI62_09965 [bacterium]|nr:hypothetical protein [bacterium]HPR88838.1 hypothetical protein [bacterium]
MNDTTGKSKSRLGRNLSALLSHSEESLIKAMGWKGEHDNGRDQETANGTQPIETLTLRTPNFMPSDLPDAAYTGTPKTLAPGAAGIPQPENDTAVAEEWFARPADTPAALLYQITCMQLPVGAEETIFHIAADQRFALGVTLQLPLLTASQPVPPAVSRLHVYLLLFDAVKGQRVRVESRSCTIEAGTGNYDLDFELDGISAGTWDLAVHIYAALFDFAERRVLHLQVE